MQAHESGGPSDPAGTVTLTGLFKKVDDTRHRIYLTRDLSSYAEYNAGDFLGAEKVDAENSPIPGEQADRVTLKRGAQVSFVHSVRTSVTADTQSDLDVRTGIAPGASGATYGPDHTIFTSLLCPFTIGTYAVSPSTNRCTHTIYGYGPPPPPSTVPCWYTITTHTI